MRGYCILLLVVLTLLLPESYALFGRRRIGRFLGRVACNVCQRKCNGKRDLDAVAMDANGDGRIDHSEALAALGEDLERSARDLLSHADIDGDSQVTVDEFKRSVRDLNVDSDELQDYIADDEHFSE